LVKHCPADFGLLVRGGLYSGARYSELTRMMVRDFDSVSGTVLVAQSKAARPRRIYLDDEAISFFQSLCLGRSGDEPIFIQKNGKPWEKDAAKGVLAEAVKSAAISSTTFHELRHSAASRWARLGLSLAEIATQLGHADVRMTQRYAHLCQTTLADKVRAMSSLGYLLCGTGEAK
jgi:integrase